MALSTNHINEILYNLPITKDKFIGTFASCQFEQLPEKQVYGFITNDQHHLLPGGHWNAWWVEDEVVTFFDSFARSPLDFGHDYKHILGKFNSFKYLNKHLQSHDSAVCGYYCIHYIFLLSAGFSAQCFLNEYTTNTGKNDLNVVKIINSLIYTFRFISKILYQTFSKAHKNPRISHKILNYKCLPTRPAGSLLKLFCLYV